jgi:hypothetical protein
MIEAILCQPYMLKQPIFTILTNEKGMMTSCICVIDKETNQCPQLVNLSVFLGVSVSVASAALMNVEAKLLEY